MAIRPGEQPPNRCRNAAGLVCSRDSWTIAPSPSSTHTWLCLSPRSMPIVSRGTPLVVAVAGVAVALTTLAAVMVDEMRGPVSAQSVQRLQQLNGLEGQGD